MFPPEGYLSIPQTAARLRCSGNTVYGWVARKRLKVEYFPRYPGSLKMAAAIPIEDIERYEAELGNRHHDPMTLHQEPRIYRPFSPEAKARMIEKGLPFSDYAP